jgi:hypothetical protein
MGPLRGFADVVPQVACILGTLTPPPERVRKGRRCACSVLQSRRRVDVQQHKKCSSLQGRVLLLQIARSEALARALTTSVKAAKLACQAEATER